MACVSSLLTPSELSRLSLSTSAWRYEGWLHAYPLNRATVLDYFKHSPFYEPLTANNERINAASSAALAAAAPTAANSQSNAHSANTAQSSLAALRHMEGLEYALDSPPATAATSPASASYFVVRKQWRLSPSSVHVLAVYYVVAATPEPAPATASATVTPTTPAPASLPAGSVIPMPRFDALAQCALDSSASTAQAAIQRIIRMHNRVALRLQQRQRDEEMSESATSPTADEEVRHTANEAQYGIDGVGVDAGDEDDHSIVHRNSFARPLYAQLVAESINTFSAG